MCENFSPYSTSQKERLTEGVAKRVMDIALIEKILEQSQGTPLREIIPSTMGEPLLYKDFERVISLCHRYNLKLNLTTNGSFPIKGVQKWSELLLPVLSDIKISWNGASKKTHEKIMLYSKWETVLNNLKQLIHFRNAYYKASKKYPTITLQLTFLETNYEEIPNIIDMAIDLGVDRVKGHHLWAHFSEIKSMSMRRDKESIHKWNNVVQEAQKIATAKPLSNGKYIKLQNIYPLPERGEIHVIEDGYCPFLGKEAWVNTEGKFSPCCAPDKERDKLGDFGNLYKTSLQDIWRGAAYNALRKNYRAHPLCKGCNMKQALGDL